MPLTGNEPAERTGLLEVPKRGAEAIKTVTLSAGAKDQPKVDFPADLPLNLGSAIALEGEEGVFRRVINSIVIEKQGEKRRELTAEAEGGGGRKAKYMQELGL